MCPIQFKVKLAILKLHSDPKFISFLANKVALAEFDKKLNRAVLINSRKTKVVS